MPSSPNQIRKDPLTPSMVMVVAIVLLSHTVLCDAGSNASGPVVVALTPAECGPPLGARDAPGIPDCYDAIARAVDRCRRSPPAATSCAVVLAPGDYRIQCPEGARPSAAQIEHPAVALYGLDGVTFGGAAGARGADRPQLLIDYRGRSGGCAGIVVANSSDVMVRSVVVDAFRLPFTVGLVVSAGPSAVAFAPERETSEHRAVYNWDTEAYPWLDVCSNGVVVAPGGRANRELPAAGLCPGYDQNRSAPAFNSTVNLSTGVVTLFFAAPLRLRASLNKGDRIFMKHFGNMQSWGIHGRNVTGAFRVEGSSLYSIAGMGFRADFCVGEYSLLDSEVVQKPRTLRPMSITADGTHWMHHAGPIVVANTSVQGQGDDGFNIHSNFIMVVKQLTPTTVEYINERGSGWIYDAPVYMVGDPVEFYSRRTLEGLGGNTIVSADATTITFADPVPVALKRFDMFHSKRRVASLAMSDCFFGNSNSRGVVLSAINATIERTVFANLSNDGVTIIEGGCGCGAADYTEGPFSQNIAIRNNRFDSVSTVDHRSQLLNINNIAALQITGCVPIGVCGVSGGAPIGGGSDGGAVPLLAGGTLRIVSFSIPDAVRVTGLKFYGSKPVPGARMAVYSTTYLSNGVVTPTNHPTKRLATAGGGGNFVLGDDGWWTAALSGTSGGGLALPNGTYYIAHVLPAGESWGQSSRGNTGISQSWAGQLDLPLDMVMNWSVWKPGAGIAIAAVWQSVGGWCDVGGTLPPPITPDNGYEPVHGWEGGHITEPGADLQGHTFAKNITIEDNVLIAPAADPWGNPWRNNFFNLGGVDGLVLQNNTLVRRVAASKTSPADIVLYSNVNTKVRDNHCTVRPQQHRAGGAAEVEVPCVVRNASSCTTSASKC